MGVTVREIPDRPIEQSIIEWSRVMEEAMSISGVNDNIEIQVLWWFESTPNKGRFWFSSETGITCEADFENTNITFSVLRHTPKPSGLSFVDRMTTNLNDPGSFQKLGQFLGQFKKLMVNS